MQSNAYIRPDHGQSRLFPHPAHSPCIPIQTDLNSNTYHAVQYSLRHRSDRSRLCDPHTCATMVLRQCRSQVSVLAPHDRPEADPPSSYFITNGFEGNQLVASYIMPNGSLVAGTAPYTNGKGSAGINDPDPYMNHVSDPSPYFTRK